MEWWQTVLLVGGFGAFGGLLNALLAGGERYRVRLPTIVGKDVELGLRGPVFIGIGAAVVAWGGALSNASVRSQIVGCLLAGAAGSNFFTSQIRMQNLKRAADESAAAAIETGRALAEQEAPEIDDPLPSREGGHRDQDQ